MKCKLSFAKDDYLFFFLVVKVMEYAMKYLSIVWN